jgi:GalNAc-alpha-(1->4)-GalNAc-alpha-(1->3)-diNAcBac-PP-undecaprenol alpha-1,4-N-acetyl-D-galactosaminyltransferase
MTELCKAWAARGDVVTLITLEDSSRDFHVVSPIVRRVALGISGESRTAADVVMSNVRRVRAMRAALRAERPDVVVSFTNRTNIMVLLAMQGTPVPVIISERMDSGIEGIGRTWSALRHVVYPRAHGLVVQTSGLRAWAEQFVNPARVHVIPSPIREIGNAVTPAGDREKHIVAMGRLVGHKSFDTLLRAFSIARVGFGDWTLAIHGEGPDRARLESLVNELVLQDAVVLPGHTDAPDFVLRDASVFVLSSRHEAFPNVLLEASAAGCACIASDCRYGPSDIIVRGKNGVLVPPEDISALASALQALMSDPDRRSALGGEARAAVARFSMTNVLAQWEHAFRGVVEKSKAAA